MNSTPDHYEVLGIPRDASTEDVERARKNLARYWHPDRNKQEDAAHHFDAVQKSAEVLRNPRLRAEYDRDFALRAAMSIPRDLRNRRAAGFPAEESPVRPSYVPYTYAPSDSGSPGQAPSGYAPSGHAPSGHTASGYAAPGYAPPGHAAPGHAGPRYAPPGYTAPGHTGPGHAAPGHTAPGHTGPGHTGPGSAGEYARGKRTRRDPGKVVLLAALAVVVIVGGLVTAFVMHQSGGAPSIQSPATGPVAASGPASPGPSTTPGTLTLPVYSASQAELPVSDSQVLSIGPTIALLNANGQPVWRENASVSGLNGSTAASGGQQTRSCAVASGAAGHDYDFVALPGGQQTVVPASPAEGGSFALTGNGVALPDGTIRNPCTGTVTTRAAPHGTFSSTECLLGGNTVVGTGPADQMAWRGGHKLWQLKTKNPLVCNNRGSVVMLNAAANKISYVSPANGKTRWTVKDPSCAGGCLSHSHAVHMLGAANVLILTDANHVLALNRYSGHVLWQKSDECALQARVAPNQAVLLGPCDGQSDGQGADPAAATVVNPATGAIIGSHQVSLAGCSQGSQWSANTHRLLVVCPDTSGPSPTDQASLINW